MGVTLPLPAKDISWEIDFDEICIHFQLLYVGMGVAVV